MIPGNPQLVGLDTNVLLRAILRDDRDQSAAAIAALGSLTEERRGFVTQVTLAEVFWVLSRVLKLPREVCLDAIRRIVETDAIEFDDGEGIVRALHLADEGADFADALIHEAMRQFGTTETLTFDRRAASRLGWTLLVE